MKQTHRQSLYEQYKNYSNEQLTEIINDDDYEPIAKEIAKEILNSDRIEYHQKQKVIQEQEEYQEKINNEKTSAQLTNPLYDDLHQMAHDVHTIKNIILFLLISSITVSIISVLIILFTLK